jgi:hypothetical protein
MKRKMGPMILRIGADFELLWRDFALCSKNTRLNFSYMRV